MKRGVVWVLGIGIATALGVSAWQRTRAPEADAGGSGGVRPAPAVMDVPVALVERRDVPVVLSLVGRTEARASVAVKARLDGVVSEVAYREGEPVHQGQLLARLDDAVLQSQLRQAQAVVARDQAVLEKSRLDLKRNESLLEQSFVSASVVDQARSTLHADEATLQSDQAATENVRLQAQYTRIVSPIDGVAGIAQITAGGAVKANDTTLVTVDQVDPIYVTFTLPESKVTSVREAMRRGPVSVQATVSGARTILQGQVAFLDNAVDTTSGTLTAKAIVANHDRLLTPGQFASLRLELGKISAAVAAPTRAVESGVDGPYVFVVDDSGRARVRNVKVTTESDGWSVIAEGLSVGDRVVLSGQEKLRDRMSVHASTAASAAATQ